MVLDYFQPAMPVINHGPGLGQEKAKSKIHFLPENVFQESDVAGNDFAGNFRITSYRESDVPGNLNPAFHRVCHHSFRLVKNHSQVVRYC